MNREKQALLRPENCCLHLIDLQESLMAQIHEKERVVATARLMLQFARVMHLPIMANTQYKKGLGPYVPGLESLVEDIPRPDKVEFSALANAETRTLYASLPESVTTVLLTGVETHICIYQTAVGILAQGRTPWIVADGVSARSPENHLLALQRLRDLGAIIGPAEMIIYELLGRAGTPTFKEVLPLIVNHPF
jgi:nicotinamidase-related amidase